MLQEKGKKRNPNKRDPIVYKVKTSTPEWAKIASKISQLSILAEAEQVMCILL